MVDWGGMQATNASSDSSHVPNTAVFAGVHQHWFVSVCDQPWQNWTKIGSPFKDFSWLFYTVLSYCPYSSARVNILCYNICILMNISTPCPEKRCNHIFVFAKCWLIFRTFSSIDMAVDFWQNSNYTSHHTSYLLSYYLVKCLHSKIKWTAMQNSACWKSC